MVFQKLEGETAVLRRNGVYLQCDIYERNGGLYAKVGNGFVRFYANGATSQPDIVIDELMYEGDLFQSETGKLDCCETSKSKRIHLHNGMLQIAKG